LAGVLAALGMGGVLSLDGISDALSGAGGIIVKGKCEYKHGAIILKNRDDDIGKHSWVML